jgi:exodeoxyribonuclease VII large subunit
MEPDGLGALYIAYEQLKNKLESEGLFDNKYKKSIPKFPEKIGVVTSPTGAAIRDILNVIKRRYPLADVTIYPTLVQGEGAAKQIASAIEFINTQNECDVIITGRGGGSIEDLWCFNEEVCARAIFNSNIPVISAVGHETDFTIADFVADLRAPTPSAAAEIATPDISEIYDYLVNFNSKMYRMSVALLNNKRDKIDNISKRFSGKSILYEFENNKQFIDSLSHKIDFLVNNKITDAKQKYINVLSKLEVLNPLNVLKRGYTIATNDVGEVLQSVNSFEINDEFTLNVSGGKIKAITKEIINEQ